jgi:hypothetical protein
MRGAFQSHNGPTDVDVVAFNAGWQGDEIANAIWAVRPVRAF